MFDQEGAMEMEESQNGSFSALTMVYYVVNAIAV